MMESFQRRQFQLVLIATCLMVASYCCLRTPPSNRPPIFLWCPRNVYVTASKTETRASVYLTPPILYDPDNDPVTINRGQGASSLFPEGLTPIYYRARDARDETATCEFYVIVTVIRCGSGPLPSVFQNGQRICSHENLYGSTCYHSCNNGYRLQGPVIITCTRSQMWDATLPTCVPVSCGAPAAISNGDYSCPNGYQYGAQCMVRCITGHTSSILSISCTSSGQWTPATPCYDTEPPKLRCPSDVRQKSGPLESEIVVNWPDPVASDNSGDTPNVTSSLANGSTLRPGQYSVLITARDSSGNTATCSFIATVAALECDQLDPPTNGFMQCSHRYVEGSVCRVSCDLGYQINGSTELTCLDTRQWSQQITACAAVSCGEPPAVKNGYYECAEGYAYFSKCQLRCSRGFQPSIGLILCQSNAQWSGIGQCEGQSSKSGSTVSSSTGRQPENPPATTRCPTDKAPTNTGVFSSAIIVSGVLAWVIAVQ